jgi:hypothetical protein
MPSIQQAHHSDGSSRTYLKYVATAEVLEISAFWPAGSALPAVRYIKVH